MKKLFSILFTRCPRCGVGAQYENQNPYVLNKLSDMHKECPVCRMKYSREPGYWFGAMFMSYGLSIFIAGSGIWISTNFFEPTEFNLIMSGIGSIFVMWPYTFRLARSLWLGITVKYVGVKEEDFEL